MIRLLTQDEVIEALRLDEQGLKRPDEALRHLRRMGKIGYVKVGRRIVYREQDVEKFIEENHEQGKDQEA